MSDLPTPPLEERVDAYASWVRDLRRGVSPPSLGSGAGDPLAHLGRELELLSASISRREDEMRRLFDLVQTVERGVMLDEVLGQIFDGFRDVIPFERIGCAFVSDDGSYAVSYWARSELGAIRIPAGFRQPLAGSSLAPILVTGQPRIINDLEAYLAGKPDSVATRLIVDEGGRSSLTCPLVIDGRPLGFLFFTSRLADAYQAAHQSVFRQIAGQVSSVIEKSRLYERLIEHNQTLVEKGRRLEFAATHDALTGLLNRRAIEVMVDRLFARAGATATVFGALMADIDHFKAVNDTYGHAAGDLALREFVRRVAEATRKTDTSGRWGGEEFVVLVDQVTEAQLLETAERVRLAVRATPFDLAGTTVPVTVSIGAAHAGSAVSTWAELVGRADQALYRAKTGGRDRTVLA